MKNKRIKITFFAALLILLAGVSAALGFFYQSRTMDQQESLAEQDSSVEGQGENELYYQGNTYEYNSSLTNLLFLGIDKDAETSLSNMPGTSGQSDCILLISLNREDQTARILQISRDTMTDIDLFDVTGEYYTTVKAQLATQYAYGTGVQSSCYATKKTVRELLFDLPIDGYFSMNLTGISILNDAVGGVTLTIPEDYSWIDPSFTEGNTITLTGEQAEKYVRRRDITVSGSNDDRMHRQMEYLPALIRQVRQKAGSGGDFYHLIDDSIGSYIATDLSADQMNRMATYQLLEDETEYLPGTMKKGEEHDEFYVDDEKMRELLIKMFYKKKKL